MAAAAASGGAGGGAAAPIPTKEELRKRLSPLAYTVTQEKGTERPYTSELLKVKDDGVFKCVCCGQVLYSSAAKFDSGCGWPSFVEAIDKSALVEHVDRAHGMVRTEITCSRCGAHLGHVFDDGPRDRTGMRHCVNGVAVEFVKR